jgi:aminomethyltransferase
VAGLVFMQLGFFAWRGAELVASRSGYTGEDGFEVLVPPAQAEAFARALLDQPEVKPIGLGARDTLRLEAGLCLYGHDLTHETSPIEADLAWVIQKRRRAQADFPGAARILAELANGPARKRVGLVMLDKAPAREGAEIVADGRSVGRVTSGTVGPTVGRAIAMAYVETAFAAPGTRLEVVVRNQPRAADVVSMPFAPHRYVRG